MKKDEAVALLSGEFGKRLLGGTINYVINIAWGTFEQRRWRIHSSGTCFFLDCGAGPFLVTAAHVYEAYVEALRVNQGLRCQLGQMEFDLADRLICSLGSDRLDIATFRISADELAALAKQATHGRREWPPANVTVDDGIFFGGFPGRERFQIGDAAVEFGLYVGLTPVSSCSERHFGCSLERDEWIDVIGNGIPEVGYDLGGISGGPAFSIVESAAGLISWQIAGVVYNATASLGEIVLIHHARFIMPNGQLQAPA